MPLLAINLSDTLSDQIKVLVEKCLYRSFESFLEIAAFNQLAMERAATPAEIVDQGHRKMNWLDSVPENGVQRGQKSKAAAEPVLKASRTATIRSVVEPVARVAMPDEVRVTEADYETAFRRLALAAQTDGPKPIAPTADKLSQERSIRPGQPPAPAQARLPVARERCRDRGPLAPLRDHQRQAR